MYCGECGAKNPEDAQFCAECGKTLAKPTQTKAVTEKKEPSVPKEKKKMSKNMMIGLIAGVIAVILIIVGAVVGNKLTDPTNIAKKYFEAMTSYNGEKIYPYLDVKESEFANKKIFKKVLANSLKGEKSPKITNYKVTDTNKSSSGLMMYVTITYTEEGSTKDKIQMIELAKDKKKKYLFFDQWKIAKSDVKTVEDFELTVMKDSTVTLEGIKVDKKYIDKKESTKTTDVYKLPSLFPMDYEMKVTLPLGVTLEDTLKANRYSKSQEVEFDEDNLSKKAQKKITEKAKADLKTIYESIIAGKSFEDIKSSFEYKNGDIADVKTAYDELKSSLSTSSSKLTKIEYKDVTLNRAEINDDGYLEMYFTAKFDYTIQYKEGAEDKTKTKTTTDGVYLTYDYQDGAYHLVDASSLQSYFSIYF